MKLKSYTDYLKRTLKIFWEHKSFKYAFLLNIAYVITSFILALTVFRNANDFRVFYDSTEKFLNDFQNLYNPTAYDFAWEFRYFPLSPLLFIPFYVLGFEIGFILFNIFNFILNILICVILFRIISILKPKKIQKENGGIIYYISLYLIGIPQVFNYFLGQVNLYVTFLTLLALYIFLKYKSIKWDFIGSIILGISILFKPITILLIPFLIVINVNLKNIRFSFLIKRSFIRIFSSILPLLLNVIVFLLFPKLWNGFMETNFTGSNPTDISFSLSLTKQIMNFFVFYNLDFNQTLIFIIILSIFGLLGFLIYFIRGKSKNSIIFGFTFGILITFISYFEVWEHHLLTLIPFLILILLFLPDDSKISKKYIKPSFYAFNFLHLVFLAIFLLTYNFFPYNFGISIFFILSFYGVSKICFNQNRNKSNE